MPAKTRKWDFWDNLIPPKGGLFGAQLAGWTPGPAAQSGLGCGVLADQMVEVAPSIRLAADVYVPKALGRYPAVIAFAAYSKELQAAGAPAGNNETGSPPVFTDRGYAHVIATRRGMGRSGGEDAVYLNDTDVEDHAKVIQWAAAQPQCVGVCVGRGGQPDGEVIKINVIREYFGGGRETRCEHSALDGVQSIAAVPTCGWERIGESWMR